MDAVDKQRSFFMACRGFMELPVECPLVVPWWSPGVLESLPEWWLCRAVTGGLGGALCPPQTRPGPRKQRESVAVLRQWVAPACTRHSTGDLAVGGWPGWRRAAARASRAGRFPCGAGARVRVAGSLVVFPVERLAL